MAFYYDDQTARFGINRPVVTSCRKIWWAMDQQEVDLVEEGGGKLMA